MPQWIKSCYDEGYQARLAVENTLIWKWNNPYNYVTDNWKYRSWFAGFMARYEETLNVERVKQLQYENNPNSKSESDEF